MSWRRRIHQIAAAGGTLVALSPAACGPTNAIPDPCSVYGPQTVECLCGYGGGEVYQVADSGWVRPACLNWGAADRPSPDARPPDAAPPDGGLADAASDAHGER